MNIELLNKIKKDISKVPDRFNMHFFGEPVSDIDERDEAAATVIGTPKCNTQACIAGEACLISGVAYIDKRGGLKFNEPGQDWEYTARKLLKLSKLQAKKLFYFKEMYCEGIGWPESFEKQYREATTPKERARVAVERIDHFIKTKGKQ